MDCGSPDERHRDRHRRPFVTSAPPKRRLRSRFGQRAMDLGAPCRPAGRQTVGAMKPAGIIGIVLIIAGVLALAYQGIRYTTRETVVDLGPIHATEERQKTIPLPPIIGIAAVAGGVALLLAGGRRS